MQLLTVGRSLSEARDQPHRYKLRTDRWPSLCEERAVVDRGETWGNETVTAERTMNTEMEILAQKNAEAVKAPYPHGRWTLGVNPFKGRRGGSAIRNRQAGTVQGELSLDQVRPIRNELNEADLVKAYESEVDPRLNYEQSLELAFLIARKMKRGVK